MKTIELGQKVYVIYFWYSDVKTESLASLRDKLEGKFDYDTVVEFKVTGIERYYKNRDYRYKDKITSNATARVDWDSDVMAGFSIEFAVDKEYVSDIDLVISKITSPESYRKHDMHRLVFKSKEDAVKILNLLKGLTKEAIKAQIIKLTEERAERRRQKKLAKQNQDF